MTPFCIIWIWLTAFLSSFYQAVTAFAIPAHRCSVNCAARNGINHSHISSSNDDWDWGPEPEDSWKEEDPDPRVEPMRSMLEASWDGASMGAVPSDPEKAASAAVASIADAMGQNKNVLMIDLRLPSYDITEGPKLYDILAAYDFCSSLSDNLRERQLIRKSLVLVRNEKERLEIDRVTSRRGVRSTGNANTEQNYGKMGDSDAWGTTSESESEKEVVDFRAKLMTSWEPMNYDTIADEGSNTRSPSPVTKKEASENDLSHRLWSMVGSEEISDGPDMFDQVISAVDENARLSADEDALIILSPYSMADVVGMRRIMARYGQTRTVIIVNSRMETLPRELYPAVLVYGILPLITRSRQNDVGDEAGVKVVVMKRFPADWEVFIDVHGDGFVKAKWTLPVIDSSDREFPSSQWIAQCVQAHVEGLSKQ